MPAQRVAVRRVLIVVAVATVGFLLGIGLRETELAPALKGGEGRWVNYPLPHLVPKYSGGVALRFAMVHDVIHERIPRHGKAYYEERNRLSREALEKEKAARPDGKLSRRAFELIDDIGAGLDLLGRSDEGARLLRDKLKEQQAQGLTGRDLYTTYANLGTFLIHGNFRQAQKGNAEARKQLREGLAFIHKSIKVNPEAHFGREIWQAVTAEFLLAAMDNPRVLLTYDLAGNQLAEPVRQGQALTMKKSGLAKWRAGRWVAEYLRKPDSDAKRRERLRGDITHLGASWEDKLPISQQRPVPFDEPVLGVVGMWRLGGGANPHFALCLGETMYRVGQRHIAWCAYERAVRLADKFWPDPTIRKALVGHCRTRQAYILESLPPKEMGRLPERFDAELAHGLRYQEAYQRYEKEKIAAGVPLDDPHFYDDFHARHGNIASPPGDADYFRVEELSPVAWLAGPLLVAGLFACCAAGFIWINARRTATPLTPPSWR